MLAFVLTVVFIPLRPDGGPYPRIFGKKVEPFEMKMAVVGLPHHSCEHPDRGRADVPCSTGGRALNNLTRLQRDTVRCHASARANSGSAFAGLNANTPFINVLLSALMLSGAFYANSSHSCRRPKFEEQKA